MHRLTCVTQSYEWGVYGASSTVAQLMSGGSGCPISPSTPYAELWMGTHPSGPSHLAKEGGGGSGGSSASSSSSSGGGADTSLQGYLSAHPQALGPAGPYSPASALPFLLKVLSVGKALSVQAHPDRALARTLHTTRPDLYKDDNHKPEMAVALTPFEAMCSFRAPGDFVARLAATPELGALAGEEGTARLVAAAGSAGVDGGVGFQGELKAWYTALMGAPRERVEACTAALGARLGGGLVAAGSPPPAEVESTTPAFSTLSPDSVARRLLTQYPGDVGVFAPYMLNCLRLHPGTSLFLGANEPHAYLAGDCVEVMATSDNVVRAGLTPKFKDVPTLTSMLTYRAAGTPGLTLSAGAPLSQATREYTSPVPEFKLQATSVGEGVGEDLPVALAPSILLVLKGQGEAVWSGGGEGGEPGAVAPLSMGTVWFIASGAKVSIKGGKGEPLEVFRALPN
jgi:mannose-6-phosphate isomerase